MKKLTTEEFIMMARDVHGDKYDYSKVVYVNATTKVCIICPIHGEFWQTPIHHLKGCGCKKCAIEHVHDKQKKTYEEYERQANLKHSFKYTYHHDYNSADEKIKITCPIHGDFYQEARAHLQGHGCPKCSKNEKYTNETFIDTAIKKHGKKYDYSKVNYVNWRTKVCIICPEHGEFWQTPNRHLNGDGCPACAGNKKKNTESFISESIAVHGNKYIYTEVEYKNIDTKVCVICPVHGKFWTIPYHHLKGVGCPYCNESHLEKIVDKTLLNLDTDVKRFYKDKNIFGRQSLDFYLPKYKIAIECQGEQHFKSIDFFGGEKTFKKNNILDINKKKLCEENGIKLLYFTNLDYDAFLGEPLIKTESQLLKKINEIITTKTTI